MSQTLYCGDTSLNGAAAYLAGLLTLWGCPFDYVPSDQSLNADVLQSDHSLFVFSDYPSARLAPEIARNIAQRVRNGAGLLMIGGWESFHGLGGNWDESPLAAALPVTIGTVDDRVNSDQAYFVKLADEQHEIVKALPWAEHPPLVGGFNRIVPRADAQVVLEMTRLKVHRERSQFVASFENDEPLLVVGKHGAGRTAAFASDIAPHWIGPMVDWGPGPKRVTSQAPGAEAIEVGAAYAQFFQQLLSWCRSTSGFLA